eukprot:365609-Chlamydomonas_euryale.AAC.8
MHCGCTRWRVAGGVWVAGGVEGAASRRPLMQPSCWMVEHGVSMRVLPRGWRASWPTGTPALRTCGRRLHRRPAAHTSRGPEAALVKLDNVKVGTDFNQLAVLVHDGQPAGATNAGALRHARV